MVCAVSNGLPLNPDKHPLCCYFLEGYLSAPGDPVNFPAQQFPDLLDRYEAIFKSALDALRLSKETLRSREEFNFDSGDAANFESAIGVLRTVETLRKMKFINIQLLKPPGADILCQKGGQWLCCEVKTITKQSTARPGFFADQLYEKIVENIPKARAQLAMSAAKWQCAATIFACISNWFDQAVYLNQQDYQYIVNRLEKDPLEVAGDFQESLKGIDSVLFITRLGNRYLFLNDRAKFIDE